MLHWNPLRLLPSLKRSQQFWRSREETHELLTDENPSDHLDWSLTPKRGNFAIPLRKVQKGILYCSLLVGFVAGLLLLFSHRRSPVVPGPPPRPWEGFKRLDGYAQGIRRLVAIEEFIAENANDAHGRKLSLNTSTGPPLALPLHYTERNVDFELLPYQPYLKSSSETDTIDLPPVQQCFLDVDQKIPAPSIYAFHGVPQRSVEPLIGSYDVLDLRKDICFDRYGRYGSYGLGYGAENGGSGLGMHGDRSLTEPIWATSGHTDWRSIDLGDVQRRCYRQNQQRFNQISKGVDHDHVGSLAEFPDEVYQPSTANKEIRTKIPRTAVVLRVWGMLQYTPAVRLYIRSLVNELSLYSGGEYEVHLLVDIKNKHKPIWTSQQAYDKVLAETVPEEFRSMATLWSEPLMHLIYPGPFEPQFSFHGSMYAAMRSMHFALQWFMVQHPEYEYFWNWEMDLRYIGHFYELLERTSMWAKKQPRDHLWERNGRFYVPSLYENWDDFIRDTKHRSPESIGQSSPNHDQTDGTTEEADFISFNPIFDPDNTLWNRRNDVTGYDTSLPIPKRRASIIVAARFSRRLLLTMHNETHSNRHGMASEMFPASMCLHHGLKAVFAPLPLYLERDWPAEFAEEIFNGGSDGQSGGYKDSVFGEGPKGNERALVGTTFYYNSRFAGLLWRRWMGYKEEGQGGAKQEIRKGHKDSGGRMCLRSMMLHPIKRDVGVLD